MLEDFVPIFVMLLVAGAVSMGLLLVSFKLGPSRPSILKGSAYESGMDPIGTARERFSVKFYLVAMIFIVFDVEIVFMYPWAVSYRDFIASGAGLTSLTILIVFVIILMIGLLYDIKKGGLDWD